MGKQATGSEKNIYKTHIQQSTWSQSMQIIPTTQQLDK